MKINLFKTPQIKRSNLQNFRLKEVNFARICNAYPEFTANRFEKNVN